jgi:hypothetical protein
MLGGIARMRKYSWLYCTGCFVLGLAVGYICAQARAGRAVANSIGFFQLMDIAQSEEGAMQAYKHDSVPVAIYAMTELLNKQKAVEQNGGTAFLGKRIASMDLMFTHARLAKLYAEAGQTNLSEQHISEALHYDRDFTNRDELMDFISKVDKGAK